MTGVTYDVLGGLCGLSGALGKELSEVLHPYLWRGPKRAHIDQLRVVARLYSAQSEV